MPLRPNMQPSEFLEILSRRKWLIVFSFLVILFVALVYCVVVPNQYQSNAKILIIPPAVAEGMVRSTVNLTTRERLRTIEQDILSRPRLLSVIQNIGVAKLGFGEKSENEMLGEMRKRIEIGISKNKEINRDRNVETFVLSFLHENPKVAQEVSSSLCALFIGENIKLRETVTQETMMFLDNQLAETRSRLEQQEEKLKGYKILFGGELPQQENANLSRIQRLADQIKSNSDTIARLQDRKVFLESQVAAFSRSDSLEGENFGDYAVPRNLLVDLAARKKKLEEVNRKYTPLHPAVVQAQWELAQAEAKIAEAKQAALNPGPAAEQGMNPSSTGSQKPGREVGEVQRLRTQIAQADLEINALKRESANKSAMIDEIQRKVERLPQREQEIIALTRDYNNLKKSYDELLEKKLKANISMNLEEDQKGERFQVLEPADLPSTPAKPNRLQAIGLGMLVFLVVGIGGAFGLEILDPTLKGSKEFRSFFEIPILASLPVIQNDAYNRRVAIRSKAIKVGLASIAGAYVVFLFLHGPKIRSIIQSIATNIGGRN